MARGPQRASTKYLELKDEVTAIKRRRILEEACQQFFEKGYDNTSLDSIAEGIGVTKPFIYSRFAGKAEILVALCEIGTESAAEAADYATGLKADPATQLTVLVERFAISQIEHRKEVAVYFREIKNLPPEAARRIEKIKGDFHKKLSNILSAGQKDGLFSIDNVSAAAAAIGGMISWTYTWYQPSGRLSINEVARNLTQLALNMVKSKGPETAELD